VLGVGLSSSDTTSIVTPGPPPGDGGGVEPAPVLPAPGLFIKPSTPSLLGSVQGINVLWNGLNSAGEIWPYDTSWVEIHMSTTGTAFTPETATLKGRLTRPGSYFVGGLAAGTTYHFRLRGADPAGYFTDPSDAASGQTGQAIEGDLGLSSVGTAQISFNARTIGGVTNSVQATAPSSPLTGDVWLDTSPGTAVIHKVWNGSSWVTNAWGSASIAAGQITALQLAAGAVTAGAITAGTINGWYIQGSTVAGNQITGGTITGGYISGGTVSGGFITGGTVEAARFATSALGSRVRLSDNVTGPWGTADAIEFYDGGTQAAMIHFVQGLGLDVYSNKVSFLNKAGASSPGSVDANVFGDLTVSDALRVDNAVSFCDSGINVAFRINSSGEVFSYGVDDNTTANAANVRVGASAQLLKSTSTERVKDHIISLGGDLAGVDPAKISTEPASANPYDVLEIAPVEFQSLAPTDGGQRLLGFIAENVAEVFPWAAEWDEDGIPSSVSDRPVVAALLAIVKDQQTAIMELTARVAALEA
jgi:hypothetical protein